MRMEMEDLSKGLPVEDKIQILRNAIEFLEFRHPGGEDAMRLRDEKIEQLRYLEALAA